MVADFAVEKAIYEKIRPFSCHLPLQKETFFFGDVAEQDGR